MKAVAKGIHLTGIRALDDLRRALTAFAPDCRESVQVTEADISRKIAILEDRCRALLVRIECLQYDYDHADPEDDDRDYIGYQLREAEAGYERARSWLRRAEAAAFEFARAAARAREL